MVCTYQEEDDGDYEHHRVVALLLPLPDPPLEEGTSWNITKTSGNQGLPKLTESPPGLGEVPGQEASLG